MRSNPVFSPYTLFWFVVLSSISFGRFWGIRQIYSFLFTLPSEKYSCLFVYTLFWKFREVLSYTAKLQFPSHSAWVKSIPVSSPYTQKVFPFYCCRSCSIYSNAVQSFAVILLQVYGFLFHPAKVKVLPFLCCKLTEVLFFDLLPVFWGPARSYSS